MKSCLPLLNYCAVSIFGSVLAAAFCNVMNTRRKYWICICSMAGLLLLQGSVYALCGAEALRGLYPLVVHLPLMLVLYALTRHFLWSLISVLTAYLCCQLRRWIALFIVALASGDRMMQSAVELILTLPILLLLLYTAAPAIHKFAKQPVKHQLWFGIIPTLYYIFDYATVVYTDLLISATPVVVEFMPFVCCGGYLVFALYHSAEEQKRSQLRQVQDSLDIQLKQSVREISALRESQTLARRYRHDLRHHLQYIATCIENGRQEQAQEYISDICREIEAQKVKRYCENETVNLIFSSFDGRAEENGIHMNICGTLPALLPISERDLCVLLSNILENAIHACMPLVLSGQEAGIDVQFYESEERFFLQVTNPYKGEIRFERGIPVSDQTDHGIGIQSICAIVERYQGIYSFQTRNDLFILRLYL